MILVDGDILVYRCGWAAEKTAYYVNGEQVENKRAAKALVEDDSLIHSEVILEPVENALQMVRTALINIRDKVDYFGDMKVYLTGDGNFREKIATLKEYKGNRKDMRKPYWYDDIRFYLTQYWDAEVIDGQEADDAIGIQAWRDYNDAEDCSIIVSTDKDLDMLPGFHYNWVKGETYFVEEYEAMQNFYTQVLTGDTSDNIPGVPGIGPVKAAKALEGSLAFSENHDVEAACYYAALDTYGEAFGDKAKDTMYEVATLLWIRREPDEMWEPFKYNFMY